MTRPTFCLLAVLLIGCVDRPQDHCEWHDRLVRKVLVCDGGTSGLISSRSAKCRVELDNGVRATIESPVAVGDVFEQCEQWLWMKGRRDRSLISSAGFADKTAQ